MTAKAKLLTKEAAGELAIGLRAVPANAHQGVAILHAARAICLELAALRKTLAVRSGDPFRPKEGGA